MRDKLFLILKIVFVILMLLGLNGLFLWHNDRKEINEEIKEVKNYLIEYENEAGEISYNIDNHLKYINKDIIGWVRIDDTNIDYPFVRGENNKFYLNHDFYKEKNSAGWVFMDAESDFDDQNIVIYGHHRRDKIMFGDVDRLFKEDYYDDHDGRILIVRDGKSFYYQIFSVYSVKSNDDYNRNNYDDFASVIEKFAKRSKIKFDYDLKDARQILTLSTCHNNNRDRLVVHAYNLFT